MLLAFTVKAQEPFMFHYSAKDGLPSSEVHSIYQDSDHYIWICTNAGLVKYNANTFKVFESSNGLVDNTIFEVEEDAGKRVWYRTLSGGVGFIRNDSAHSVEANKKIVELQGSGLITSLHCDEKGVLLLGLQNPVECFFLSIHPPYKVTNVKKITANEKLHLGAEAVLRGNKICFSEIRPPGGPVLLSKDSSLYAYYKFRIQKNDHAFIEDSLVRYETGATAKFYQQNNEQIFLSRNHLFVYSNEKKKELHFNTQVLCVLNTSKELMIGLRKQGVQIIDTENNIRGNFLNGKSVSWITKDNHNGYWFGTLEDGVYYCPNIKNHHEQIVPASDTSRILESRQLNDSTFIVFTGKGIVYSVVYNKEKISSKQIYATRKIPYTFHVCDVPSNRFLLDVDDVSDDIQIKVEGNKVEESSAQFFFRKCFSYKNSFAVLFINKVGLVDTIGLLLEKKWEFTERLNSLAYDDKNSLLYAGGNRNLFLLDPETSKITSILNIGIADLLFKSNKLFIATKKNGLIIKKGSEYDTLTTHHGLLSNTCSRLFLIDTKLWILTTGGFSCLDVVSNSIRNYPFSDHIFPESINNLFASKGTLVFFDDREIHVRDLNGNWSKPVLRISSVMVNNTFATRQQLLELEHDQSDILINFEALLFEKNRRIQYRYKLEGIDHHWKYLNTSSLNLSSLSPGNYKLLIEVLDTNEEWVACSEELNFVIRKPLWLTWWFITLEVLLLVTALGTFIFIRYKRILTKERKANAVNALLKETEIKALRSQMNPHFISNCLVAIQELIQTGKIEEAGQYLAKFSFFLRKILTNSDKSYITLEAELEIIKLNIELEKLRFKNGFEFNLHVDPSVDEYDALIPSLITQTFIENAIWHGLLPLKNLRQPRLSINIFSKNNLIFIEIEDNGVGRKGKEENKDHVSKGSQLIADRLNGVNKLNGTEDNKLSVIDLYDTHNKNAGTRVILQLTLDAY